MLCLRFVACLSWQARLIERCLICVSRGRALCSALVIKGDIDDSCQGRQAVWQASLRIRHHGLLLFDSGVRYGARFELRQFVLCSHLQRFGIFAIRDSHLHDGLFHRNHPFHSVGWKTSFPMQYSRGYAACQHRFVRIGCCHELFHAGLAMAGFGLFGGCCWFMHFRLAYCIAHWQLVREASWLRVRCHHGVRQRFVRHFLHGDQRHNSNLGLACGLCFRGSGFGGRHFAL